MSLQAALRYCLEPHCPNKVSGGGRCAEHGTPHERFRGSAHSRGYGARWRAYRRWWLSMYPTCGERVDGPSPEHSQCQREYRLTLATVVDHIVEVTGPDDPTFYEPRAHQSLCVPCHNVKHKTAW